MKKLIATIIKEWQLMRRDISGLILLLLMPAALIIVMALVQDAPFKDYRGMKFDLLLADNDNGALARQITQGLKSSANFHIIDSLDGKPVTQQQLKDLLNKGDYKIGIVIPAGVTAEVANSANIVVNDISRRIGLDAVQPTREMREQMNVHILFDPVSKPAFRTAISSAVEKFITYSCTSVLMQRLGTLGKANDQKGTDANTDDLKKIMQGIGVTEEPVNNTGQYYAQHVNSVQHNVPAWAIFGMFFIAIPIASHIIKERQDGSAVRIALIPNANIFVAMGKIFFYTLICSLQFGLMLCIGLWTMPFFGLPALYAGLHPWLLFPVSLSIGFAATAYGYFTGAMFKTFTQALPFSSVSIVMLSAIGGIWVPVEVLPHSMQQVALISPLHWALDAVNQVIIRNGDITTILLPCAILLAIGCILWGASMLRNNANTKGLQ